MGHLIEKTAVLLVDDRPENVSVLEALLDRPELKLVLATSSDEALARTLEYDFALILMTLEIPGMNGYQTAEQIRSSAKCHSIPIIFVSRGRVNFEQMFKGYDSGDVDYLYKPFEPHLVKHKVGIFLELYRQRQQVEAKARELDAKNLELEVLQKELEEKNTTLEAFSSLDDLTGLFNRHYFDDNLLKEWKQALRTGTPLSLLIVDIDHFKCYNDRYGHQEGDDCLRKVAQGLYLALLRPIDIVARYGGEEFTVILPNTDRQGAEMVALRMMENIAGLDIHHEDSATGRVTVSIGIAAMVPSSKLTVARFFEHADKALYEAKKAGRNALRAKFPPVA